MWVGRPIVAAVGGVVVTTLALEAGCSLAFPIDDRYTNAVAPSLGITSGPDGGPIVLPDGATLLDDGAVQLADGAIVVGCTEGTKACGGTCVGVDDPAFGCSADACDPCGSAGASAQFACQTGACVVSACSAGHLDCDGDSKNGCEVDPNVDPTSCGGCANGHAGQPVGVECCGTCQSGACVGDDTPTTLIPMLDRPAEVLLGPDEKSVYIAEGNAGATGVGRVLRFDAATGATTTVIDNLGAPSSMIFVGDEIVVADSSVGRIARAPRTGGPATTVATSQVQPRALAASGSRVYWAQGPIGIADQGDIRTVDLATDAGSSVLVPAASDVHSMAISGDLMAWGHEVNDIVRLGFVDGGVSRSFTPEERPRALAFVGGVLYWADRASSNLRRIGDGGAGAPETVQNQGYGLGGVGFRGSRMFFGDMQNKNAKVFSANLDGQDLRTLVSGGLHGPSHVAATSKCLYVLEEGDRGSLFEVVPSTGALVRVKWTP
jgi:hypothetical protein